MVEGDRSGKVVNLFTRKPVEAPQSEPDTAVQAVEENLDDSEFFEKNGELVSRVVKEAGTMERMISRIPGFSRNERNVGIRMQGLKETPLSALCESILTSTQNMWREKPSYYLAVISELSGRIDAIQRTKYGSRGKNLAADTMFALGNFERVRQALDQIDAITVYVMDECGIEPNFSEMTLHAPRVASYTLGQLCDEMLDSTRDDWRTRSNYYGAVITELDQRRQAIKAVLENGDGDQSENEG